MGLLACTHERDKKRKLVHCLGIVKMGDAASLPRNKTQTKNTPVRACPDSCHMFESGGTGNKSPYNMPRDCDFDTIAPGMNNVVNAAALFSLSGGNTSHERCHASWVLSGIISAFMAQIHQSGRLRQAHAQFATQVLDNDQCRSAGGVWNTVRHLSQPAPKAWDLGMWGCKSPHSVASGTSPPWRCYVNMGPQANNSRPWRCLVNMGLLACIHDRDEKHKHAHCRGIVKMGDVASLP